MSRHLPARLFRGPTAPLVCALVLLGCSSEPRRPAFSTLDPVAPFSDLGVPEILPVWLEGEPPPSDDSPRETAVAYRGVDLGSGFGGALPCAAGWAWGLDDDLFVAVHRGAGTSAYGRGSSSPESVILVVDHSSALSPPTFEALRAHAVARVEHPSAMNTRFALVAFTVEADEVRRDFVDGDRRTALLTALRGLRTTRREERLLAGLSQAQNLLDQVSGPRRVVALVGPEVDVAGADIVAGRLARDGIALEIVTFGGRNERLAAVATAGGGTITDGGSGLVGGAPPCVERAVSAGASVDAWIVATRLFTGAGGSRTIAQARFLADVDPELAGISGLTRAAGRAMASFAGPELALGEGALSLLGATGPNVGGGASDGEGAVNGSERSGSPSPADLPADVASSAVLGALTRTGGRGMGFRSEVATWTGWRWIGENRHHVHLRLSRVQGSRQPTDATVLATTVGATAAERLGLSSGGGIGADLPDVVRQAVGAAIGGQSSDAGGAERPTPGGTVSAFIGFATTEQESASGLGIVLACADPACASAATFARFLAEIRAPGHGLRLGHSASDPVALARAAGFVWLTPSSVTTPDLSSLPGALPVAPRLN